MGSLVALCTFWFAEFSVVEDGSSLPPFLTEYQLSFGITSWYELLKEVTFRSEFIPLSFAGNRVFL
jgi:hypothetical protein